MSDTRLFEGDYVPAGPAMGSINGENFEKIHERIQGILASPLGVATFGSIGSRSNQGNGGETYFHDPLTGETVNSMGLPNVGIETADFLVREYQPQFADAGKTLMVGVTSLRGENAADVLPVLVDRMLDAGAKNVEVNYSCPNIVTAGGGRKPILGYDLENMVYTRSEIFSRLVGDDDIMIWEKLPPFIGEYAKLIPEIAELYNSERWLGRIGVVGFNTIPNTTLMRDGKPVLRVVADVDGEEVITHAGGLSGPAVAGQYAQLQADFLKYLPEGVPFIAAGGVWGGQDIHTRMSDPHVVAATGVSRFWEGERAGHAFGRSATQMAEEYSDAA